MKYQHHNPQSKALMVLIVLLIIAGAYTAYQVYNYYFSPRTIEVKHFMFVEVITHNITDEEDVSRYVIVPTGSIQFRAMGPGYSSTEPLEITNIWRVPVELTFNPTGAMAPWLTVDGPKILKPEETTILNLTLTIPETAGAGKYKGDLNIRLTPK